MVIQGVFQGFLEPVIEGQDQILTRLGRLPRKLLDHAAPHVHFFRPAAVRPAQILVIDPFQAVLANNAARRHALIAAFAHLGFGHFAHIAQDMGGQAGVRIAAYCLRRQGHVGQVLGVLFQEGDLLHIQFRLDGHRFIRRLRLGHTGPHVLFLHGKDLRQEADFRFRHLTDIQHEGRRIVRQDNAVAVVDPAPRRQEKDAAHTVAVGLGAVIHALVELEPSHAAH